MHESSLLEVPLDCDGASPICSRQSLHRPPQTCGLPRRPDRSSGHVDPRGRTGILLVEQVWCRVRVTWSVHMSSWYGAFRQEHLAGPDQVLTDACLISFTVASDGAVQYSSDRLPQGRQRNWSFARGDCQAKISHRKFNVSCRSDPRRLMQIDLGL